VYELQWRALREGLEQIAANAEQMEDDDCLRLALCCLLLLYRHPVDLKGRCRRCRSLGRWWHLPTRQCSVVPALWFYMKQPRGMLKSSL